MSTTSLAHSLLPPTVVASGGLAMTLRNNQNTAKIRDVCEAIERKRHL
jgi:hypothetical protein